MTLPLQGNIIAILVHGFIKLIIEGPWSGPSRTSLSVNTQISTASLYISYIIMIVVAVVIVVVILNLRGSDGFTGLDGLDGLDGFDRFLSDLGIDNEDKYKRQNKNL